MPRLRYAEFAPEGLARLRGFEHYLNTGTALPPTLREFVRLRCSQLNGCSFCVGFHTAELRKLGEPEARIDAVHDWNGSDAFSPPERAALAWADALTDIQDPHASDADYAAATQFFTGKELVDLSLVIAGINAWNRLSIAFSQQWEPRAKLRGADDGSSLPATGALTDRPSGDPKAGRGVTR